MRESIRRIVATGASVVSTLGVYESFSLTRSRIDTAEMAMLAPDVRREVEETHASNDAQRRAHPRPAGAHRFD